MPRRWAGPELREAARLPLAARAAVGSGVARRWQRRGGQGHREGFEVVQVEAELQGAVDPHSLEVLQSEWEWEERLSVEPEQSVLQHP